MRIHLLALIPLLLVTGEFTYCQDWPGWMGSARDGRITETDQWLTAMPADGLKVLWRQEISGGYAGPAVADGRVYVMDYVRSGGEAFNNPGRRAALKGHERVLCLDAKSGKQIWEHRYPCAYSISYPAGPRCTPTVDGEHVYCLGAQGDLYCLKTSDGQVVWAKQFEKDYGAPVPIWGHSAHPLVDGQRLLCMVGGSEQSMVAMNKATGETLWSRPSVGEIGYCPPKIIKTSVGRQLVTWYPRKIESVNPDDGKPYWTVPIQPQYGMSITMPQQSGDLLYASSIGAQSVMLRLSKERPDVEELWRGEPKTSVYCANSTPLLIDGVVFGSDCQVGHVTAVDAMSGERLWTSFQPTTGGSRRASQGTAFITAIGDQFYLFAETGDLIIAQMDKKGYSEIGRQNIVRPTGECFGRKVVWAHPAYAQRSAFIRNDEEIVCVSLDQSDYK